jgi:hypothetical protein
MPKCNSPNCAGCYELEPGVWAHPPKPSPEWEKWRENWTEQEMKKEMERDYRLQDTHDGPFEGKQRLVQKLIREFVTKPIWKGK